MKQQKIVRNSPKKTPIVINEKQNSYNPNIRVVNYVEVGNLNNNQIQQLLSVLHNNLDGAKNGMHYFVPVRDGKITSDLFFEEEWLKVVNKTCEIKGGQIVLKDGIQSIAISREIID